MSEPNDPNDPNDFGLVSRTLGGLPIITAVLDRLGLPALLAGALPAADARIKLAPAVAIRLVVTNLVLGREPLYGLGEWAARYDPALLGLSVAEVGVLNDDRVGRGLESLFDADRASLLTAVVLRAISEFNIDTTPAAQRLHIGLGARGLPGRGRHRAWRQTHPGDHPRTLQGPPSRPETAGVDPHRGRRRRGPDRPPARRR